MVHGPLPSIDLEGAAGQPMSRRRSALSLRSRGPALDEAADSYGPQTPPLGFFTPSPSWPGPRAIDVPDRPASPPMNHFSTLPPSSPEGRAPTWSHGYLATPPDKGPSTAAIGGAFQLALNAGVTVVGGEHAFGGSESGSDTSDSLSGSRDDAPVLAGPGQAYGLLGVKDSDATLQRRPSLVFTSPPSQTEPLDPLPVESVSNLSPRFRRQYPEQAPISNSPSDSPKASPTILNFPSTFLSPNLSATLPISSPSNLSPTLQRKPSSPRLGAFTDELGRLAHGIVRRASNSSLKSGLPTAISRSPSPSPSPSAAPSPTGSPNLATAAVAALSPLLGSGAVRRSGYASQAREKEKEKEAELRERELREYNSKKAHLRMFSWAERPGDIIARRTRRGDGSDTKRVAFYSILFVGAGALMYLMLGVGILVRDRNALPATPPREFRSDVHPVLRRRQRLIPRTNPEHGNLFIHPDVVNRPVRAVPASRAGAAWRWVKSVIFGPPPPPIYVDGYLPGVLHAARTQTSATGAVSHAAAQASHSKGRNIFVPAGRTKYSTHHALPPPPVHSDAPERDTLVLYRILGNDLPPRHSPGQTLRNLRFMLSHESDFSSLPHLGPHAVHHAKAYGSGRGTSSFHADVGGLRVDKYFVLNRIADPQTVMDILTLLKSYSVPNSRILIIPFEWAEYERQDFRWDGGVDDLAGWGIGPLSTGSFENQKHATSDSLAASSAISTDPNVPLTPEQRKRRAEVLARLRALDFTYHEKNLYAMNNNGGRNFALAHGRALPNARWILPLDGNSFFTPAAMYSIVKTLSIAGEGDAASRYLIIPMARLLDNEAVLANNSITLVPKEVLHDGLLPEEEADHHHRPDAAPETPEEPQVGFRYDSTESYQEAMRYGRRSKLELLWRLGAIPYSRGLDRRTMQWESSDREHVTADTWGTIPGVGGFDSDAAVFQAHHHAHSPPKPEWEASDPERGPLAFCKAGWVYRLFSGDQKQEHHNPEAIALRNTNRIKGIVGFIEALDEKVARGFSECGSMNGDCGFSPAHLWNFDIRAIDGLRNEYKAGWHDSVERVDEYEEAVYGVHASVRAHFALPGDLDNVDPEAAATNASILALAGYLTGNASYSTLASDLITARFVRQVPMFYRANALRDQLVGKKDGEPAPVHEFSGVGYGFPPPLTGEIVKGIPWGTTAERHAEGAELPSLPFDPMTFDPTLLLDAVRLLSSPNAPKSDFSHAQSQSTIQSIFVSHLSFLLFSPKALAFSMNPPSADAGAHYDAKVAALAGYLDDPRLFIRVANRARLRLPPEQREDGLLHDSPEVRLIHWRMIQGCANALLVPWSLATDPIAAEIYWDLFATPDSPFHLLRFD